MYLRRKLYLIPQSVGGIFFTGVLGVTKIKGLHAFCSCYLHIANIEFLPRELITATSFYGDTANSFSAALDSCYEAAIAPFPGH